MVPGQSYEIEIDIPADHTRGTYWYHPHHHGGADIQIAGGMAGERVIAVSEGRRILSWVWYVGVESTWREALRELFALDHSPFRRVRHAYVVRLSTDLDAGGKPEVDRAERRLRLLARSLGARLPTEPRS